MNHKLLTHNANIKSGLNKFCFIELSQNFCRLLLLKKIRVVFLPMNLKTENFQENI